MRIVRKHHNTGDAAVPEKDKSSKEFESSSPSKQTILISGALTRGDKDFPPAATQVAHHKPQPCVEKLAAPHQTNSFIHQPRK
ncbi:death-associated protein 1-like [Cetorhinus maximus]